MEVSSGELFITWEGRERKTKRWKIIDGGRGAGRNRAKEALGESRIQQE